MLIRVPDSWSPAFTAAVAMVLLAALDILATLVTKEAVVRHSAWLAALGFVLVVALFWIEASSLQYADLAPLTFGWIILVQIGVIFLDRFRYQVHIPTGAWVAIVVMIVAQGYLILAVQQSPESSPSGAITAPCAPGTDAPCGASYAAPVPVRASSHRPGPGRHAGPVRTDETAPPRGALVPA